MSGLTLGTALMLSATAGHAALSLSDTRVIINGKSSSSVEVLNNESVRYGMQAWVEGSNGQDPGKALVVTPNFQAIDGKQKIVLRLLSFSEPGQQEQLYYLNVQEIPPKPADNGRSQLSMAVRTKIKVLVRPAALGAQRKNAEEKIEVSRGGQGLVFKNPTPYYFAVTKITAGGKTYSKTPLGTFAPMSTVDMRNISGAGSSVSITYLNDYGGANTAELKVK
ncbi:molecular chaperone [Rahnella laticis]|uniref:fimbrial biogenesis chaperone n=1 Tax=Rahnella laticis TaxID=2787622 RepID=UPI0018A2BB42|nr:fimbria/pilus periplasmic chaperone [Rahnella laticis]MBF7993699.1 fimbria/pilus periplasmic chaperone [Rahnella laticis]